MSKLSFLSEEQQGRIQRLLDSGRPMYATKDELLSKAITEGKRMDAPLENIFKNILYSINKIDEQKDRISVQEQEIKMAQMQIEEEEKIAEQYHKALQAAYPGESIDTYLDIIDVLNKEDENQEAASPQ